MTAKQDKRKKQNVYVGVDVILLLSSIQHNPWENGKAAWNSIVQTLQEKLSFLVTYIKLLTDVTF